MRATGLNILPAVTVDKHFLGFVYLNEILECKRRGDQTIEAVIHREVPVAYPDTTVEQMLPFIAETDKPVAVVHPETNKLVGLISQTALIIETTGSQTL
jgi:glycine betaine/proline transport system ATP-binding protein